MAKLSTYRRLITNDFEPDDRKLVGQLSSPINDAFNELYFAMNGRLSLKDNSYATVKDIEVIVNASGTPLQGDSFVLDKTGSVIGCQVIAAVNATNSAIYPTGQPFISFSQNATTVVINNITNLQPNQRYTIRVVAYLG